MNIPSQSQGKCETQQVYACVGMRCFKGQAARGDDTVGKQWSASSSVKPGLHQWSMLCPPRCWARCWARALGQEQQGPGQQRNSQLISAVTVLLGLMVCGCCSWCPLQVPGFNSCCTLAPNSSSRPVSHAREWRHVLGKEVQAPFILQLLTLCMDHHWLCHSAPPNRVRRTI